ncbi:von Willebrand factor D and EGF domain-containing protein-like [Mytilus californianus]|uniref:von Willebrand factor D and EGF domain-containing protein-like n=1 Tax=Mytilus californianus TaxID=6549 RepID=UPI00224853BE|nr:von Willebrand factor D and EGF domain-containing protein-like [Mytilus californianus]
MRLRVYGFSDSLYNFQDRSTILKISTSAVSDLNEIWRDVQVPDIKITVIDRDSVLIDRQCMSHNDPHITTFDGRLYHYMNVGEFIMYQNDIGPYSVHALFTNCGFGWTGSSCHCGIAVRSCNSLFVLRTCQTISRTQKHLLQEPITKLISCDAQDLMIEHNRNNYKITLPTGTEIKFTISRWSKFISMIAIKPSIFDINEARGLCGVPSTTKDKSEDFTHRQNGPINNEQSFADSWRITPTMISEQLFCVEPDFFSNLDDGIGNSITGNNNTRYCTCERQASSTVTLDDFDTVQCNLTEITEFFSEALRTEEETMTSFSTSCSISQRKKRSVNSVDKIVRRTFGGDDDVIDVPCFTYDESVFNTEVTIPGTFRNGWTENTAWQTCMDEIQNALPPGVANLVDVSVAEFVESCVLDIKLVGDTTFLPDTIGTMLTFIMTEIRRNESLYLLNTTDGSQTLVGYVTSFLCPNNCSENGNCTMGVCQCNGKYIGDDCSQSNTIPPSNISLPSYGLCILGTGECRNPKIFGNFLSRTVWYNIKYFQKVTDSIKYIPGDDVLQANFRNMFTVSLDLMSSGKNRSTPETIVAEGFEISLSYDGTNFGESVSIIIYDENCYSCNSTSIACFEQNLCNPTVIPTAKNDNKTSFVAIAAALGGLLLIIIVVIGCIYYKVKSNSTRTKINATSDKLEKRPNLYLDQSNGSQILMTRDKTISDLQLEIDDSRGESPFEMFENQLHFVPPPSHYKRIL